MFHFNYSTTRDVEDPFQVPTALQYLVLVVPHGRVDAAIAVEALVKQQRRGMVSQQQRGMGMQRGWHAEGLACRRARQGSEGHAERKRMSRTCAPDPTGRRVRPSSSHQHCRRGRGSWHVATRGGPCVRAAGRAAASSAAGWGPARARGHADACVSEGDAAEIACMHT